MEGAEGGAVAQGCAATVCMLVMAPAIEVDALRRLGGRVDMLDRFGAVTSSLPCRQLPRYSVEGAEDGAVAQGCAATVCMPVTTPAIKVDAVLRLGGRVDLHGDSYSETQTYAQARTPLLRR